MRKKKSTAKERKLKIWGIGVRSGRRERFTKVESKTKISWKKKKQRK